MSKGIFTISLDFELFWGVRDHRTLKDYGSNIRNVHKVVPRLLSLFEQYDVHCTWATVGFLFLHDKKELLSTIPASLPTYQKKEYDPYAYLEQDQLESIYHFAPLLIDLIRKTKGQEIGTHTFSHFYTLEKNTTAEQFREDLRCAIQVAKQKGISITSIVFPRNQYGNEHISICEEMGINVYRGNENSGFYQPVSREDHGTYRRGVRLADSYLNITGHHCHPVPSRASIVNIPASRFLRPYSKKLNIFDPFRLSRITKSIKYAAMNGLIYHLWWHPHNFGRHMDENFAFLEKILKVYSELRKEGRMESLNLNEIYQITPNP